MKDASGNVRVQLYGNRPDEFLAKGAKLARAEAPAPKSGEALLCVPVEKPGTYALAALHDRNANGRLDVLSDGVGFSGNPALTLSKPRHEDTAFAVRSGIQHVTIVMNYRRGLSVRPTG
jgi:uncharacterized protein (DUF2141 family)